MRMIYQYLKEHNLKFTPYITHLYSFLTYIESIRLCVYDQSLIHRYAKNCDIEPNLQPYIDGATEKNAVVLIDSLLENNESVNANIEM